MSHDLDVHACGVRYDGYPPEGCPDPGAHRNYWNPLIEEQRRDAAMAPGEEPLIWRALGKTPTSRLNRGQARQILSQAGDWDREMIDRALDVSSRPGQGWRYDIGDYRVYYHLGESQWTITRWRHPSRFDPVPHLAALIDGLHDACTDEAEGAFWRRLGELMSGPYAALRGGLLLDIPGPDGTTYDDTETAIRAALAAAPQTSHR